jgi:hypothetical protein
VPPGAEHLRALLDRLSRTDANPSSQHAAGRHAKIALESVSRMPGQPAKAALSTGVCTMPNYVQRNAGMKAEWHHTFGFAIAEIEADGEFWVRTVSACEDGSFQDLDVAVADGKVTTGCSVEAITWGDIHVESLDPEMARLSFGIDAEFNRLRGRSMLDQLQPRFQFFHDLINFTARSHHTIGDPVFQTETYAQHADRVEDELQLAAIDDELAPKDRVPCQLDKARLCAAASDRAQARRRRRVVSGVAEE